jgi:transcriptional regulator with XRE-family HTH domain
MTYIKSMSDTQKRIKNPKSLERLGKQVRLYREQVGIAQGKVRGMRQATVSKIENGGDVTLDTFISYAASLGLEVAVVPVGQAVGLSLKPPAAGSGKVSLIPPAAKPVDLLTEFSDLRDEE